jgi:hypothetical protein
MEQAKYGYGNQLIKNISLDKDGVVYKDGEPIAPNQTFRGYYITAKSTMFQVDRLMLYTFVGPPPGPTHVTHHVNGDKLDNRMTNLMWSKRGSFKRNYINPSRGLPFGIRIRHNGLGIRYQVIHNNKSIGTFSTLIDAIYAKSRAMTPFIEPLEIN